MNVYLNQGGLVNLMFIDLSMYRCNDDLSMVHYKNCWTDTSLLISCNIRPISTVQKNPMGCATRMSSCYLKYYFHLQQGGITKQLLTGYGQHMMCWTFRFNLVLDFGHCATFDVWGVLYQNKKTKYDETVDCQIFSIKL